MHIRILSPSGAIEPHYIDRAAEVLGRWGHSVTVATHAKARYGRFAGTENERLEDLNAAIADSAVDAVLCSRGGYGLAQIIDRIDLPQGCRKLFIGFSDITCLHNLCATRGIPSVHSIMCKHLATLPETSRPVQQLKALLGGAPLHYTMPAHPLSQQGRAEGMLRGGNLSVLYGLQATPYAAIPNGSILFIEDIGERHYHIDRMMQNLRLSGVLARLNGLVVGQFADCDDDPLMQQTLLQTILAAVSGYRYPVLFGFPAGHVKHNMPLLLNHPCTIQTTGDTAVFTQPPL